YHAITRTPSSTHLPYTTLFRSLQAAAVMRASTARPRQAPTSWRSAQARPGSATHGVLAGRRRSDLAGSSWALTVADSDRNCAPHARTYGGSWGGGGKTCDAKDQNSAG